MADLPGRERAQVDTVGAVRDAQQLTLDHAREPGAALGAFGQRLVLDQLVFESELVLLAARAGDLTGQADYLWRRTQGVIGSLTQLLTEACAEAIDTGSERITVKLLDSIDIGYAAEVAAGRQQGSRAA